MALIESLARRAVAREAAFGVGVCLLRLDRLDVGGHRVQVVVGEIAQAVVDGLLHRPERDAAMRRNARLEEFGDLVLAPGADALLAIRSDVGRIPAFDLAALELAAPVRRAKHVVAVVALAAMAETVDEIGAAGEAVVGLWRGGVRLALLEEQRAPGHQRRRVC